MISLFVITPYTTSVTTTTTSDDDDIYVLRGDIIKNFKFDKFMNRSISQSGMVDGNRLVFESQPEWQVDKDNIQFLYSHDVGNKRYLYYKVAMTNTMNVYTNVPLGAAASYLTPVDEEFEIIDFEYYNEWGKLKEEWESEITWSHWNFGNIRQFNSQHNSWSGTLEMSFDIAQSPLPNIFKDEQGEEYTKSFDYITVSSVGVADSKFGLLSEDQPNIQTMTPQSYDAVSQARNSVSEESGREENLVLDPGTTMSDAFVLNSFDEGIVPPTPGSSSNPTLKNGEPIYDARNEEKSMTDCKFVVNIARLSPVIMEYGTSLSFNHWEGEWINVSNLSDGTASGGIPLAR